MAGHNGRGDGPSGCPARTGGPVTTREDPLILHFACSERHLKHWALPAHPARAPSPRPLGQE